MIHLSFRHPIVLVLLVLPALLIIWTWRRRDRRVMLPFDVGVAKHSWFLGGLLSFAESVPALVLTIVILILAGPQQHGAPKTRRALSNIEFAVDISGSMTAQFGDGTRYDASMEAINDYVNYRDGDAFGLTFFGNSVMHWVPLTTDASAFACAPPFMDPRRYIPGFGGTEIGKALNACKDVLIQREDGDRMIILVSDGYSADLGGDNAETIANSLRSHGIIVNAIHIAESEIPGPIVTITSITDGEVFSPGDVEGLQAVFRRIDEMRETRMEQLAPEVLDNYRPYSIAGLSLVGAYAACLIGWRYTPW